MNRVGLVARVLADGSIGVAFAVGAVAAASILALHRAQLGAFERADFS